MTIPVARAFAGDVPFRGGSKSGISVKYLENSNESRLRVWKTSLMFGKIPRMCIQKKSNILSTVPYSICINVSITGVVLWFVFAWLLKILTPLTCQITQDKEGTVDLPCIVVPLWREEPSLDESHDLFASIHISLCDNKTARGSVCSNSLLLWRFDQPPPPFQLPPHQDV